jgi:hypothetical protein
LGAAADYWAARKNLPVHKNVIFCREEDAMLKPLSFALLLLTASRTFAVHAQATGPGPADASSRANATRLLNENYLTSTGETVPRPGASQGAGTTDLDRVIEQKNNHLDQSICSNCD